MTVHKIRIQGSGFHGYGRNLTSVKRDELETLLSVLKHHESQCETTEYESWLLNEFLESGVGNEQLVLEGIFFDNEDFQIGHQLMGSTVWNEVPTNSEPFSQQRHLERLSSLLSDEKNMESVHQGIELMRVLQCSQINDLLRPERFQSPVPHLIEGLSSYLVNPIGLHFFHPSVLHVMLNAFFEKDLYRPTNSIYGFYHVYMYNDSFMEFHIDAREFDPLKLRILMSAWYFESMICTGIVYDGRVYEPVLSSFEMDVDTELDSFFFQFSESGRMLPLWNCWSKCSLISFLVNDLLCRCDITNNI